MVLLVIRRSPPFEIPPPEATPAKRGSGLKAEHELPLMVELVIINEPESFNIPPPSEVTVKPY
jgi:hypothetical protein